MKTAKFFQALILILFCLSACQRDITPTETSQPSDTVAPTATALPTSSPTPRPSSAASPTPAPASLWWELKSLSVTQRTDPEPPEMDVIFFRTDGLWYYDSALAQERQLVV
jgi:hypothetical protein